MIFLNKQKKIESQLAEYRHSISDCLDAFKDAISQYCLTMDRTRLQEAFTHVHCAESKADDIRRAVEVMMYSKSLFPESRGDILGLLEAMDKVPNQAESGPPSQYQHC